MKETTVVVHAGMNGCVWERERIIKEVSAEVVDCLGRILLDSGKDYCITRTDAGKMAAVFYDTRPEADAWIAKVTLTALKPNTKLTVRYWNRIAGILRFAEAKTMQKTANSAGIFEAKLPLEGADLLLLCED